MNCALLFLVVKALISFRLAYVKRFDNKPGFWGGFPRNLEGDIKARQYALAFLKPFSAPERRLTEQEKHALVVCSLAVIPPVADMEGMELEQEEPINDWSASQWATKVRDVATGMLVVPFKLQQSVSETAVNLLEKLAAAVGVPYCKHCCLPQDQCMVHRPQVATETPPTVVPPAYGAAQHLGQQTQLATTFTTPPPGYAPLASASTSLENPQWGSSFPQTQQSSQAPLRAMRAMLDQHFPLIGAGDSSAGTPPPPPPTKTEAVRPQQQRPMDVTSAVNPVMMPGLLPTPIRQQRPIMAQKAAQPPQQSEAPSASAPLPPRDTSTVGRGRGVMGKQLIEQQEQRPGHQSRDQERRSGHQSREPRGRGRGLNLNRGNRGRSRSRPRGPEAGRSQPTAASAAATQGAPRGASGGPADVQDRDESTPEEGEEGARKKKKNKATGWKKDTPRLISQVLRAHPEIPISDKERPAMIDKVIAYMAERQAEWYLMREERPLEYAPYVADTFHRVNQVRVPAMAQEHSWIIPGSVYHAALATRHEVHLVEHLKDAPPPLFNQPKPSVQALCGHVNHYQTAYKNAKEAVEGYQTSKQQVLNTDRLLVQESSGYAQLLDLFNRSTTPAEKRRPILDVPELLPPPPEQSDDDEPQDVDMDGGGAWTSPRTRKNKRRRKSKKESTEDRALVPDVMKDSEGRVNAAETMILEAGDMKTPSSPLLYKALAEAYPGRHDRTYVRISNLLNCAIQEYLLLRSVSLYGHCSIVLHPEVEELLPPREDYDYRKVYGETYDKRLDYEAKVLRVAVFLLHTDMLVHFGDEGNYMLDPSSVAWPESLMSLLTLSGTAHVTKSDVQARLIVENKERVEAELASAEPALVEKEKVLGELLEQKRLLESRVNKAVGPADREREERRLEDLKAKLDSCLKITKSLRQTVREHRVRMDWFRTECVKKPVKQVAPAMEVAEAEFEVEAAGGTAEDTREVVLVTPPPQGTRQVSEATTDIPVVAGQGSGTSEEAPPPLTSTEDAAALSPELMETGDDNITLTVDPAEDDLLDGPVGEHLETPTASQEERALPRGGATQTLPGVATDMAESTVSAEASLTDQAS